MSNKPTHFLLDYGGFINLKKHGNEMSRNKAATYDFLKTRFLVIRTQYVNTITYGSSVYILKKYINYHAKNIYLKHTKYFRKY